MLEKATMMLQAIYDHSPVGLVVVNQDTTIRSINPYMFKAFKLTPVHIHGERFGNVFNCAQIVSQNAVCGQTEACRDCNLRNALTTVLQTGVSIPESDMDHVFLIDEIAQKKWFRLSASRIVKDDDIFAIVTFSDITTLKEYEALLHYQLSLDIATGVANKYALLKTLKPLGEKFENLMIVLIDFDDFKKFYDQFGHSAADRVLEIFCRTASAVTRRQDILGRYGGDEFMLIVPDSNAGSVIAALKTISAEFQAECRKELGYSPTFSAGLSEYAQWQITEYSLKRIINQVDEYLQTAKKRGKNMVVIDEITIPL